MSLIQDVKEWFTPENRMPAVLFGVAQATLIPATVFIFSHHPVGAGVCLCLNVGCLVATIALCIRNIRKLPKEEL